MDTATDAFFRITDLAFLIKSSWIPSGSPFQLTTTDLNIALPGLSKHYGDDLPVDIDFNLKALNNITTSEADQALNAISEVDLKFVVNLADGSTEVAVEIYASNIDTTMGIVI
mmetsp:Transcript_55056/g.75651  ORF Transcript_55056/g.75651 Transcript_55056/m.75651 type:complete len:113 (+) Transcript_55056:119-457(+)